jgi:hypothetical protein
LDSASSFFPSPASPLVARLRNEALPTKGFRMRWSEATEVYLSYYRSIFSSQSMLHYFYKENSNSGQGNENYTEAAVTMRTSNGYKYHGKIVEVDL